MSPRATEQQRQKLIDLIGSVETAMLVTVAEDGALLSRPMVVAEHEEERIYFLSERNTGKVHQIGKSPPVNVCVQDDNVVLSLAGEAEAIEDDAAGKTQEVWRESWKVWFPEGPNDPTIQRIRFLPRSAEYWDLSGMNGLRFALEWSRALLRGEKLEVEDQDTHDRMEL